MNTADNQSSLIRPRLVAFALALVTLLVYLPACFHDWIYFDDPSYVLDNEVVQRGITWAGIKWAFIGWHASNWHPLTWLSHMLDCQLFGVNPGPQHCVNILFHAANSALLFVLWHRLTRAWWPSAVVAALFAWHPLHVESVAWIAERKDVLSTFFGLLALLAYVEKSRVQSPSAFATLRRDEKSKVWWVWALVFFGLGLMAKPMLVTLPFVFLLLDYWPLQRLKNETPGSYIRRWTALCLEKWPFFLLSGISCVVTFLAQRQVAVLSLKQYSFGLRLENVVVAYGQYLLKTFWPSGLAAYYPLPDHIGAGAVGLSAAALLVISALTWRWRTSRPYVLMGWLWFLGTLVPVIGLVQVGSQAMADRYMYLPAVGLFVAVVFGIAGAQTKFAAVFSQAVMPLLLVLCVGLTERQLSFWQNTGTLFDHTLAVTKNNGPAHMLLGAWYDRTGNPDQALPEYQLALKCDASLMVRVGDGEMRPLAAQVQLLLGQSAEENGKADEALAHYREALALDSSLVEGYNNLGNLLNAQGKPEDALANYQSAAQLQPESPLVHENLGSQLLQLGRFDDALAQYQQAARLAPHDSLPFYLMGKAWLHQNQDVRAVGEFEQALNCDSNDFTSLTFLARVLAADENPQVRDGSRAVALAEKANTITLGKQPYVLGTLAMAYAEAGRFDNARQTAKQALELAPTNSETFYNLQVELQFFEANRPYREKFGP